jgi:hypothetical protein
LQQVQQRMCRNGRGVAPLPELGRTINVIKNWHTCRNSPLYSAGAGAPKNVRRGRPS